MSVKDQQLFLVSLISFALSKINISCCFAYSDASLSLAQSWVSSKCQPCCGSFPSGSQCKGCVLQSTKGHYVFVSVAVDLLLPWRNYASTPWFWRNTVFTVITLPLCYWSSFVLLVWVLLVCTSGWWFSVWCFLNREWREVFMVRSLPSLFILTKGDRRTSW